MHLSRISIENFRGIPRLALDLDRDTVVIGENNHGKTSLLDVLQRCLGPAPEGEKGGWEYRDFRRVDGHVAGPIQVVLEFEATDDAQGATLSGALFATAMAPGPDGVDRLRVRFCGDPESGAMATTLLDGDGASLDLPDVDAVIARLRRAHPVLLVRLAQPPAEEGLTWRSRSDTRDFDAADGDDVEAAITQVYHRLLRTRGAVPGGEVRRGLQAVRALSESGGAGARAQARTVEGLLSNGPDEGAPASAEGSGSHALGLLMVLGALLDARGAAALEQSATPLILIEEPEVHLHPMLLSSAWRTIQGLGAQTIVTTNSGELLAEVPLRNLRRLVRKRDRIETYRLRDATLSPDSLRRVAYHVRAKRGVTLFARCWLMVEGETEFWLLQELARVLGYDLATEGVRCVEFAQCGVAPLVGLANDLGIRWHLISDGDESGVAFASDAARRLPQGRKRDYVTRLDRRNVEMLLWDEGFEDVYLRAAGVDPSAEASARPSPRKVVERAVRAHSKPYLALLVAEECARRGSESVPQVLRHVIEASVRLARAAVEDGE